MSDRLSRLTLLTAILLIGAQLGIAGPAADAPATPRMLTVDDLFKIGEVDDPQISPDGRWVAYTVTISDIEQDESTSRIWMVPAAGGEAVPMTAEEYSASHPRWSPDNRYLAFLSAPEDGEDQVWTLFREGGEAVPRTDTAQSVSDFEWSPDGKRMVLVLQDPTPVQLAVHRGEEEPKTPPPWVITRKQFKMDYIGYLDSRRSHLYVLDIESEAMTQITSGDFDDEQPVWSPDGEFIAFVSNRTEDPDTNYNTDIWVVAANNQDKGQELLHITTNPGPDTSPAWSPDGRRIAYMSATDTDAMLYATNYLAIIAEGGEPTLLTAELDRNVSTPRFSSDGKWVLFGLEDSGEQSLARIPTAGGEVDRVIGGPRSVGAFTPEVKGLTAALISMPHLPPEVFMLQGGSFEQLTHTNDELMSGITLGDVEKIHFESKDGTPVEGFAVKPPGFVPGTHYPAILLLHGGPQSQYDFSFDFEAQLYAANGYVVVLPNPRGSTGYGQDFCLGIWRDWGGVDFEDVMASVDSIIERGWADPERLGVGGWSYGGILTDHVITKTDRFKAAYTGASEVLYVVNYGHDQYQRWWVQELGLPWRDRQIYEDLSPFNRIENLVTPTLIVGGEEDWNVPIINSEQLYQALRHLGRTTELVVYPGEGHVLQTPSYNKDLYERILAWFATYIPDGKGPGGDES
jgi:dipeptidyl aminopeptidase/acylaminoacyl peptidase